MVDGNVIARMREAFNLQEFPIYLFGPVGVGKSFAAALVYVRINVTASMIPYADLVQMAIESDRSGEVSRTLDDGGVLELSSAGFWKWVSHVGVMIVDEIGTGAVGDWKVEALWRILDARKGLPTILTGNIDLNVIAEHFDERIKSRITEGTVIRMRGEDKRRRGLEDRVASYDV